MKSRKSFNLSYMTIALIVIVIIIRAAYMNFIDYRDSVITQQQDHLLTIAKSISRSLDLFIRDKDNNLSLLAKNPIIVEALNKHSRSASYGLHEEILQTFYEEYSNEIDRVLLLDAEGLILYQYPTDHQLDKTMMHYSDVEEVLRNHKAYIGKAYKTGENQFSINIIRPIFKEDEFIGILVNKIALNSVYEKLVRPVKAGEKGYAMIKSKDGVIMMHLVREQVGIQSLIVRKEMYPQYNWAELEELNRKQVEEGEGTKVYHSIWWQEKELVWAKKLSAFTTIELGNNSWIVAVQMAYSEIEKPIREVLIKISITVLTLITVLLIGIYKIMQIERKQEALELETKYLRELNQAAEALIKSEARLRHSQKLQTIGTLTGGIAHEFNNLLTPILGYSEIVLNNLVKQNELYEDIQGINKAAIRAKEIIDQILTFSRNDDITLKFKPLEINSVIKEGIKLFESVLPNNIKLIKEINYHSGYILGNATQIQQVILNLCTNAYHSMKENGGILEINVQTVSITQEVSDQMNLEKGDYVRIKIKDTGCGMDQETLNQIFDPFFTTKEVGEGTGLGLSVVHGIVKNHNGDIYVESEIDVGTTIFVHLPLIDENEIEGEEKEEAVLSGEEDILLIDDDPAVLKVLKKGMEKYGYRATTEKYGLKAIRLVKKNPELFKLVIVDYTMPNISGFEIAKKLRKINSHIKIILISGFLKDKDYIYKNNGLFDDYVLKPILIADLVKKINKLKKE